MTVVPSLAAGDDLMSHVLPHHVVWIGGFDVTNHVLMTLVAALLVVAVFLPVAKRVRTGGAGLDAYLTRGRIAQLFEVICVFLREEVARPALGMLTDRYIKFIWTTFFFILFCNLLGMIPLGPLLRFVAGNEPHLEHWGGTPTGNISVTGGLAAVSFFMIHFVGIREQGWRYFAHFNPGPAYMAPLLVPLELIGALVKPFALCVRLFANMVAGHLVLGALISLIFMAAGAGAVRPLLGFGVVVPALAGSLALSLLELFVAFLQAFIFTFLTVLFIAAGAVHEHEHSRNGENESAALVGNTKHDGEHQPIPT